MSEPTAQEQGTSTPAPSFNDDDFVYIDPETSTVVAKVDWSKSSAPKMAAAKPQKEEDTPAGKKREAGKKYYPWGTYRSMKHVFRLEGKKKRTEDGKTLDEILPKALEQPFWD